MPVNAAFGGSVLGSGDGDLIGKSSYIRTWMGNANAAAKGARLWFKHPLDSLTELRDHMMEDITNGLCLGWLINSQDQQVDIYRANAIEVVTTSTV